MNSKELEDILELLKSTGGKYIIVEDGKPSYVVMNINEYKKMALNGESMAIEDMSKEELIEKINKDIAIWHAGQNEEEKVFGDEFLPSRIADNKKEEETDYFYEDLEDDF